jgi:hypothetical protein
MLTEYEVRRQLELIQTSDAPPGAKARNLLRLGKSLRTQAQELVEAQARASRSQNVNANRQLERMAAKARMLREEVRGAALAILRARQRYRFSP